jgi:hypothetical protein
MRRLSFESFLGGLKRSGRHPRPEHFECQSEFVDAVEVVWGDYLDAIVLGPGECRNERRLQIIRWHESIHSVGGMDNFIAHMKKELEYSNRSRKKADEAHLKADKEAMDTAVRELLFLAAIEGMNCLSRGGKVCVYRAVQALRPDIATLWGDTFDAHMLLIMFFPSPEDEEEQPANCDCNVKSGIPKLHAAACVYRRSLELQYKVSFA